MRNGEKTVLVMILSFSCRSLAVPPQSYLWKKKTRSVTEERHFVR
ncbi:secreted protein [gut metagenome]|uniref:Secreted protein n=1 Tax=gut metagenome TaxID=749906 RepID=J9BXU0_9ZZZZ